MGDGDRKDAPHISEAETVGLRGDGAVTAVDHAPRRGDGGAAPLPSAVTEEGRYALGEELGRGGAGRVVSARDRRTGRTVALKTLKHGEGAPHDLVARFLEEARVTAQLEHPSIVPVYDLGVLADGTPFYTMRVVQRRSLRDVLRRPELRAQWPLARLCTLLAQVCRGVAYAHARGVVHRDLKPSNILVGEYGEVYVADWGIAKVLGAGEESDDAFVETAEGDTARERTRAGAALGTPGYMSPEQERGDWAELDHRTDVFALGTILYEVLTGRRPWDRETRGAPPVPPRAIAPDSPLVLEDLCLKCLQPLKEDRPAGAEEVARELEAFLEGAKERERRREEALRLADAALEPTRRYHRLAEERASLSAEARRRLKDVHAWDPIERKKPGWEMEGRARLAEIEQAKALAAAVELYSQALGHDSTCARARAGLADLYWSRMLAAEQERREATRLYYEALVLDYDDGLYAARLGAGARLSLRTRPTGATVVAWRLVERDRRLQPEARRVLGTTPLTELEMEPGAWLLVLEHPGYRDVRYPLRARRGEHHDATVNLYTDAEIGDGFVYVPAGPAWIGGDPDAFDPLPRQETILGDYAIGRFNVTLGEYVEWMNELQRRADAGDEAARDELERRLPRDEGADGAYLRRDDAGLWIARDDTINGSEARRLMPTERMGEAPLFAVSWYGALAYAAWRSAREGRGGSGAYRLPTEAEFEKAARGTDERYFPWGDAFDPTFAKMRESRPGLPQVEPVTTFPLDESPYGVRGLAGHMRTWVADVHGVLTAEEALAHGEPEVFSSREERDERYLRIVRGGSWAAAPFLCRAASRVRIFGVARNVSIGFRLARTLGA